MDGSAPLTAARRSPQPRTPVRGSVSVHCYFVAQRIRRTQPERTMWLLEILPIDVAPAWRMTITSSARSKSKAALTPS